MTPTLFSWCHSDKYYLIFDIFIIANENNKMKAPIAIRLAFLPIALIQVSLKQRLTSLFLFILFLF